MRIGLYVGLFFSPIAVLMAFLISYGAYTRHFPGWREPFRLSLRTAALTWVVFVVIGAAGGWIMEYFVTTR